MASVVLEPVVIFSGYTKPAGLFLAISTQCRDEEKQPEYNESEKPSSKKLSLDHSILKTHTS